MLLSVLALSLVATLPVSSGQAAGTTARGPSSTDFAALLDGRDPDEVRAWFERHEAFTFHRPAGLLRALISIRLLGDATALGWREADAGFLAQALGERPPAGLVRTVLGWDLEETRAFADLERELEVLAAQTGVPDAERLELLRAASEEIGAAALLTDAWATLARRLYTQNRLEESDRIARWVGQLAGQVGDLWKLAWSLEWRGQHAWQRGDLRAASDLLTRAAELNLRLGDPAYCSRLYGNLASVHLALSDVEGGLRFAERAEELARTVDDPDVLRSALQTRAALHFDLGEHQTALEICTSLIPADPKRAPRDVIQLHVYLTAANVLSDVGRLESALAFARRARELSRSPGILEATPVVDLEVLLTLGLLLGDTGETAEALELLAQARAGFEEMSDPLGAAWADKNRGWVLLASGDRAGAITALESARETGARLGVPYLEGLTALGVAEALVGAARSAAGEERLAAALEVAERRAEELSDLQLAWRAMTVRGRMQLEAGQLEPAYARFEAAVELIERWRRRLSAPGLLAHSLRDKADPYREAAFVAARLGRTEDALRMTELLRARVLDEARSRRSGPLAGADPSAVRRARRELRQAERALRETATDDPGAARLRAAVAQAEAALDGALLAAELGVGAARDEPTSAEAFSLTGLQDRIARGGIDQVLSYLPGPEATLAIAVDRERASAVLLPVGEAQLSAWIARLRDPIEALRRGEIDLAHLGFDAQAARALAAVLLGSFFPSPAEGEFQLVRRLVVVADGVLSALPFEMLVTGGEASPVDPRRPFVHLHGLDFLAQQCRIAYAGSFSAVVVPDRDPREPGSLVALVAPREVGVSAAEHEMAALARIFDDRLTVLADASPADAARPELRGARYLHFLAHGEADPEFPAHGHLLLGGASDSPGASTARLEAWQIEQLSFSADLTVLAACHTGEGAWYSGEGLQGLTRSFLAAGSREVVASHWAVDDAASARLMERLYEGIAIGLSPMDALHDARLELILAGSRMHPYFWAAWVLHR